jgi:ribosomal protein S18 acetylase RimI-like enzyme
VTAVELRPVGPKDRELLLRVYAGTRADELALVDWPDEQKTAFVRHQFDAQDRHYREHYPTATFDVVLVDGEPAGRLYVERWTDEIRIMDVALLPEHRGRGVGTELLRRVQAEAASSGRSVTIHVERFNAAQGLYARLGFVPEDGGPVYVLMRWTPGAGAT